MSFALKEEKIDTVYCKTMTVHVQGDMSKEETKAVFLTVHDIGDNHASWVDFTSHPVMREAMERSIFIHVDVPGQEDNAPDFPNNFAFPTFDQIAQDLVKVLDHFKVKLVVCLGEGAGANILARFGIAHPERVNGLILVNCTGGTAGVMEHFKDKIMNWKLNTSGMSQSAEQYLVFHKFGHQMEATENKERLIKEYQERLTSKINPKNLCKYVDGYLKRSDLLGKVEKSLTVETLFVTGSRSPYSSGVQLLHQSSNKQKASLLKVDDVGDVLVECPDKFAQSMLLFCKGLGLLTSMPLTGVERQRTFSGSSADGEGHPRRQRTMSMEEYDTPNIRRFSFGNSLPTGN